VGFEAASRGAAEVLLLERDPALVASLVSSRERLRVAALQVLRADALAWMARCAPQRFELVLLDPPFDAGVAAEAAALAMPLLVPGGLLYLEAGAPMAPPAGLQPWRSLRAGAVHVHLWRRADSAGLPAAED
jgi:16S rRNA G966 N2-methylase RsmD